MVELVNDCLDAVILQSWVRGYDKEVINTLTASEHGPQLSQLSLSLSLSFHKQSKLTNTKQWAMC